MVQPEGDGAHLFWASILFLAICWLTFIARVGVRIWRDALGTDDLLMGIGLVRVQPGPPFPRTTINGIAAALHGHSESVYCLLLLGIWPACSRPGN